MDSHNDDIMCIDVFGDNAVTGQRGSVPMIFVWDSVTGKKKGRAVLNKGANGLQCVRFNCDGSQFACVDMSNDHCVYVFDTASCEQKFMHKGDSNKIYDICWSKENKDEFCTVGSRHVKFWNSTANKVEHRGIYGADNRDVSTVSHCTVTSGPGGFYYTGAANGSIFVWNDNKLVHHVPAHKGTIHAMRFDDATKSIFSGGADSNVMQWNAEEINSGKATATRTVDMKSLVRAIAVRPDGELVVGTRDGNIAIVGTGGDMNVIMSSHNDGEVWGLSCGPEANTVMSSGDDNRCMIWDIEARKM